MVDSMRGRVYKSTGNWYNIKLEDSTFVNARIKGILKLDDTITTTNPIAVGDIVYIEKVNDDFLIYKIEDRSNVLIRKAVKKSKERHILTSNIDQIIIIASLQSPFTEPVFIDKILITAMAYHIPATVVFNKIDIYSDQLLEEAKHYQSLYISLSYPSFLVSIQERIGVEILQSVLEQKTTLLIGYSGAGKTSLLNLLLPHKNLLTQALNRAGEGKHTTTFVEMYDLLFGGSVVDTPGIKEFDLIDIEPQELSHYFSEMLPFIHHCHYTDCIHEHEPHCAIQEAVHKGIINPQRYKHYLTMLHEIKKQKKFYSAK